jgi:hypothetical protein
MARSLQVRVIVLAALVAAGLLNVTTAASVGYQGTAVVLIEDDFDHGRATTRHFLRADVSGELLELAVTAAQAKRIHPGQKITVRGRRVGTRFEVDVDRDAIAVLAEPVATAAATTTRRVITLLVDITDGSGALHPVSATCDGAGQVSADYMFGSQSGRNVDGCYQDGSYGLLGFGGVQYPGTPRDVARVLINEPTQSLIGVCKFGEWASAADTAARQANIDLGLYQHRMYVLPKDVGCNWAGLAYVSCGDSCQAWVRAYSGLECGYPDTLAHELGHNLGLNHSRTDPSNDGISDCEYCDTSDIMGYATNSWRTFNAPHRYLMGWLPDSQVIDGSSGGTFTISALEVPNAPYPQAIRIVPPTGLPYWLSFRAAIGYDVQLFAEYRDRLQIHRADGKYSNMIKLLPDGVQFVDATLGMTFTQLSHTADSAIVRVRFGGVCEQRSPSLRLLPDKQYASAKQLPATRSYTLFLTNEDSTDCEPRAFPISSSVPAGWSGRPSVANPLAAPGATVDATVTVTAPQGAPQGGYVVGVTVLGRPDGSPIRQESVFQIDATAPVVTITTPAGGGKYLLNSDVRADYLCVDFETDVQSCAGTAAPGTRIATTTKGTKTFSVTATDHVGNASRTTVSYAVISSYGLSTNSLAFGNQALDVTTSSRTITLRNTAGVSVPIHGIVIAGTNLYQFAQTNDCPTELPIAGTCKIRVTFTPAGTGAKSARVSVNAGYAEVKRVELSGTGVRSTLSVNPTALSFGTVPANTVSPVQVVTITNTGLVVLPITSITIPGTAGPQFVATSKCPARLLVGKSCQVNVAFKPTAVGTKAATLRVVPGGGASVVSVALSGSGN